MKKAYVKVKNNSVKSILKRPYIAATLGGALLCALVLSVSVPKPEETENVEHLEQIVQQVRPVEQEETVEEQKVQPTGAPEQDTPQKAEKNETGMPQINETEIPQTNEVSVGETVSVGLFGTGKTLQLKRPVSGEITKPYSNGKPVKSQTLGDWRAHNGMDIHAEQGTEIVSPADGEIIRAEMDPLTGATVVIDHGKGMISTLYNMENTNSVKQGQKVKSGEKIGTAGNTAKCEMAEKAHIHFEVTVDGKYVNPEEFLK